MKDTQRIPEILLALGKLWLLYPDLRLGQLIINTVANASIGPQYSLFYLEDETLLKLIEGEIKREPQLKRPLPISWTSSKNKPLTAGKVNEKIKKYFSST